MLTKLLIPFLIALAAGVGSIVLFSIILGAPWAVVESLKVGAVLGVIGVVMVVLIARSMRNESLH